MCVRIGMQSIHDSTVPAHFAFHAFDMQPHGSSIEESSADRNQHLARLRANTEIVLATHRDLLPNRNVKHDAMSKSLLKEGMLAYHTTAAITACIDMAIPLTRANRLAAMRPVVCVITPKLHLVQSCNLVQ